jgi:hypothetical protein
MRIYAIRNDNTKIPECLAKEGAVIIKIAAENLLLDFEIFIGA